MPTRHVLLAVGVAVLWGLNFLAIHASLEQFPPLLLAGLRFLVIAVPTVLFVPRPDVELRWLVGYGLGFGTLQFLGLYLGMAAGFPTGLASLVLQSSAPFTVILGMVLLGERLSARRAAGVLVAVLGLALVGVSRATTAEWWPFALVVLGGFGWALGNLASRQARAPRPLHLTLWMSVVPPLPMFALSWWLEGPERIGRAFATSLTVEAVPAWLGLAYTVVLGTVVGSGIWVWLMSRHPAGMVAPFSMLVPVTGMLAAWLALDETPSPLELAGGVLVVGGVLWASLPGPRRTPPAGSPSAHGADRGVWRRLDRLVLAGGMKKLAAVALTAALTLGATACSEAQEAADQASDAASKASDAASKAGDQASDAADQARQAARDVNWDKYPRELRDRVQKMADKADCKGLNGVLDNLDPGKDGAAITWVRAQLKQAGCA
ncbi:EamA family transporter [Nocardioides rotundus]|uniref:EamA family transporter n=1 Tax=Nocardioides rotundus TaxID=1774216 RepID=UPI001CBBEA2A|nr:EamA family transporter [Nocardioides rotundus]UAL29680.1 EamA family transporter [Nocardioides rotundus]